MLGTVGGERLLTDLRHVAQTLHETAAPRVARADRAAGVAALRARATASQERVRRLDSDAAAVQITTVHQSKGLQYPVVHLPFASMKYVWPVDVARYHDGRRHPDARRRRRRRRVGRATSRPTCARRPARSCATSTSR